MEMHADGNQAHGPVVARGSTNETLNTLDSSDPLHSYELPQMFQIDPAGGTLPWRPTFFADKGRVRCIMRLNAARYMPVELVSCELI